MFRFLLFLGLLPQVLLAQIDFEDYKIKNDQVLNYVYAGTKNYVYMDKSCITDWGTGAGQCKDLYGKYKIVRRDTVTKIETYLTGKKRRVLHYKTRKLIDSIVVYHPKTGKVFARLKYKNKKLWNVYYFKKDGVTPRSCGTFKNGNGRLDFYRYDGSKLHSSDFKAGKAMGATTYFYSNGKVLMKGSYKFGRPDGIWKEYSIDGKLKQTTKMAMGLIITTKAH